MEMVPQPPPHPSHGRRKGRARFAIPRGAAHPGRAQGAQQRRGPGHNRLAAHQRRCGTGHGLLLPLALRCHPQMGPRCFPRHCQRPAPHTPGQYLFAGLLQSGRQPGGWCDALLRSVPQDPADGHRRLARVRPARRGHGDVDRTGPFPLPIVHRPLRPLRLLVRPHGLPGRPALPLAAGALARSRGTRRRGSIERGLETQTRAHTARGPPRHPGAPCQGGKTAGRPEDARAARRVPARCDGGGRAGPRSAQRDTAPSARARPRPGWPLPEGAAAYPHASAGH